MQSTIYDTCGLMVVELEGVNGIQPFVIEHTTNTCGNDAVTLAWIICGMIVFVSIIAASVILCWRSKEKESKKLKVLKTKVDELEGKIAEKDEVKKKYTALLATFLEELSKNENNSKMKTNNDPACQEYIKVLTILAKDGNLDNYNPSIKNDNPTQ